MSGQYGTGERKVSLTKVGMDLGDERVSVVGVQKILGECRGSCHPTELFREPNLRTHPAGVVDERHDRGKTENPSPGATNDKRGPVWERWTRDGGG